MPRRPAFVLVCAVLGAFACDLGKSVDQLQARHVLAGTVLSTPSVTISPGSWLVSDGGTLDAGAHTVPAEVAATVFFGTKSGATGLDAPPQGIAGAQVQVGPAGALAALPDKGSGNYTGTSAENPALTYQAGATISFTSLHEGATYLGEVKDAPAPQSIAELHPPQGIVRLGAGSTLTLTRPPPPTGQDRPVGFVTVVPVSDDGSRGQPTYTNVPKTALDLLKLVALPDAWKKTTVELPGSAFPEVQRTYLVVFQAVRTGGPTSTNLFTGSALLAGTADVGVVRTH